ncbi:hypothetical protein [Membranihabitans maritimus]|uniref:hypothetical protein n=1 Tax=Membranihabitans maritimus TaxID=2904244 RepID=UPI001F183A9E|nr:hypothetical protein [Membranihabitans maritimus]
MMKNVIYIIGLLLIVSCSKNEVIKEIDFKNYDDLLSLLVGEWNDSGERYIFYKDLTYEYYASSQSVNPTQEGRYSIFPATDVYEASIKFWYISAKSGRRTTKLNLELYENGVLLAYNPSSALPNYRMRLRKK